jgi:hypothetical protein
MKKNLRILWINRNNWLIHKILRFFFIHQTQISLRLAHHWDVADFQEKFRRLLESLGDLHPVIDLSRDALIINGELIEQSKGAQIWTPYVRMNVNPQDINWIMERWPKMLVCGFE